MKALTPAEFEVFHNERVKQKKRSRWDNPVRRKLRQKKEALAAGAVPEAATLGPRRPVVPMPDEYLPPNKILFIQNLPTETAKDTLVGLFSQYVTVSPIVAAIRYNAAMM